MDPIVDSGVLVVLDRIILVLGYSSYRSLLLLLDLRMIFRTVTYALTCLACPYLSLTTLYRACCQHLRLPQRPLPYLIQRLVIDNCLIQPCLVLVLCICLPLILWVRYQFVIFVLDSLLILPAALYTNAGLCAITPFCFIYNLLQHNLILLPAFAVVVS